MVINIIPGLRMPRSTKFFSYSVSKDLQNKIKVGQIVEINLRGKNVSGLVIGMAKTKPKYKLKEINKILFEKPLVTKNQIKLIEYISEYYAVGQGVVVNSLLPQVPKRKKTTNNSQLTTNKKNKKYLKELFWYEKEGEVLDLLKKKVKSKGQKLILVPEIEVMDKLIKKLGLKDKDVLKIHSPMVMGKFFKAWLEILSGKPKIILGTKISVLLPFSNLAEIVVYNAHDWDHKQSDINPRYDARQVAEWLAREHGSGLTLATPAPSVEKYYKNIKTLKHKNIKTDINIVNLKEERLGGNYGLLSDKLATVIKDAKKTFLFHNRKGLANIVMCENCGEVFKCPECDISLGYSAVDRKLHCSSCGYAKFIEPFCTKCSGPNIKYKGYGVDKVKSEINKLLPDKKVLILEKTLKPLKPLKILFDYDVVVGTEFVMNKIDFSKFDLIGFINFDSLLNRPDFRATEHAYGLFYEIAAQTEAKFMIQTYDIENNVVESIKSGKPEIFYKTELANRKDLSYPPFFRLVKIIAKDIKEKNVIYNSKKLAANLKNKFKEIEVVGPLQHFPKKQFGKYNYNIILKMPLDFNMQKIIQNIPNDFVIDVDPEKLN